MPRLPPVAISPQTRLWARFWPGNTCSVATFFQSHSSSSATSCASPVSVPCPISARAMRTTQVSSGLTTTHALISLPALPCATASPIPKGMPSASPPPAAAEPTMNLRREGFAMFVLMVVSPSGFLRHVGGHVHRRPDALVGAATADVGHRLVDIRVSRLGLLREERRRGHDLAGLAIAALRHVDCGPGLLHGMRAVARQALDGDDLVAGLDRADRYRAGAHHVPVQMHRAGAALGDAASVLGPRQADLLPDRPQKRRAGLHLHVA